MRSAEIAAGLAEAMGGPLATDSQVERMADAIAFHENEMGRGPDANEERRWLAWVNMVEKLVGHSLDGDQRIDGYSLDFAFDEFERGTSAHAYATNVLKATGKW